jgi:hypothetical protein
MNELLRYSAAQPLSSWIAESLKKSYASLSS